MKLPRVSRKLIFPSVLVAILVAMATYAVFAWDVKLMGLMFLFIPLLAAGAVYTVGVTRKRPSIRVAAAVLGVFGGVIGMGRILEPLFVPLPPVEAVLGILAFLMAIGGGVLTLARPRVAGILMLLASIVEWSGFIDSPLWNTLFLVPGGALALASEKKRPAATYVAMALGIIGGLSAGVAPLTALFVLVWKQGIEELLFWTWVLLFPGMGVLGGILVLEKPKVAARLMLISAIGGPTFVLLGAVRGVPEDGVVAGGIACLLLIIAATIAFINSDKKRPAATYVAMALGIIGGLYAGVIAFGVSGVLQWIQGIEELPFPFWSGVLLLPSMGVLGGILVLEKPKVAAGLMLISAISGPVGLYAVGWIAEAGEVGAVFAGVTCFLLIIASTIAFRAYPKSR
ncbi:hypothetical protein M1O56_04450 [Dehalococcoidia bacterium]|nr:hypothetical protein [Dehalococcoidia bacterium]